MSQNQKILDPENLKFEFWISNKETSLANSAPICLPSTRLNLSNIDTESYVL